MKPRGTLSLKEWGVVCEALASGDQVLLLRKGGVGEKRGFEIAGSEFLLFPGFEHQHAAKIRAEHRSLFEAAEARRPPEGRLHLHLMVRVVESVPLSIPGIEPDPFDLFERTRDLHVYTPELIAERAVYRPQAPLVAVVVEVRSLVEALDLADERRYAGCRSWVDLPESTYTAGGPIVKAANLHAATDRLHELAPARAGA